MGMRKSGKDAGTLEKKKTAMQPMAFCIAADVFILLPVLSFAPYRTPIGGGTQCQSLENVCSKDDLRSRIFGTFVVKFFACLPLLGFSNI